MIEVGRYRKTTLVRAAVGGTHQWPGATASLAEPTAADAEQMTQIGKERSVADIGGHIDDDDNDCQGADEAPSDDCEGSVVSKSGLARGTRTGAVVDSCEQTERSGIGRSSAVAVGLGLDARNACLGSTLGLRRTHSRGRV